MIMIINRVYLADALRHREASENTDEDANGRAAAGPYYTGIPVDAEANDYVNVAWEDNLAIRIQNLQQALN